IQVVHRAPGIAIVPWRLAFPGQGVAVPAEQGEATAEITLALGPLHLPVHPGASYKLAPAQKTYFI
ncbi:hypothetical protein, partial [Pseudomonas sp. KCJK8927]|uniref:hypothetical protein n=1 Tax=Pseudomonas sp. KCJK8927 TaxID=3344560 RepID=UPI00390581DE